MREDNGIFRDFPYFIIKFAEMSIVLADYLQRKACAWHGPAQLVSGSRGPPQLDLRLDGESRSATGPGSYRRRASVDHPACIMLDVGITAQSVTPPKSNSHRNPQSLARARDPHPGVLYCRRMIFSPIKKTLLPLPPHAMLAPRGPVEKKTPSDPKNKFQLCTLGGRGCWLGRINSSYVTRCTLFSKLESSLNSPMPRPCVLQT